MNRRLPPLNALRAFEAAARHLSFTRAAEELHVTQAAVSHQVKALEERLGAPLFVRRNRGLFLTGAGEAYFPAIMDALDAMAAATERLLARDSSPVLTLSVLPSFAARWLLPRLDRFRRAHPEIDIRLDPTSRNVDFAREDVDVGIRMGSGNYPGLHSLFLMGDDVFPVCSPALRQGAHPLRRPEDLAHHTLLHDEGHGDWEVWLKLIGVEGVDYTRGPIFTDSSLLTEAAVQGHGVALGRRALVGDLLAAGRLVKPFDVALPHRYAYYAVCPETRLRQPNVTAFLQWLDAEAKATAGKSRTI